MSTDTSHASGTKTAEPKARLQNSREALRAAMLPAPSTDHSGLPVAGETSVPARVGTLMSHPLVSAVNEGLRQWWRKHPWRPVIVIGADAASRAMVPLARRHPGRLVGGAMLVGAVLSRFRPWKWVLKSAAPAVLASVLPVLISRFANRLPLPTLLKAAGLSRADAPAVRTAPAPAPVPASTPPAASRGAATATPAASLPATDRTGS